MDYLFHSFNTTFSSLDTYRGFRLLACDGSDLAIAHNPKDKDCRDIVFLLLVVFGKQLFPTLVGGSRNG